MADESVQGVTNKPLVGTLIGVGVTLLVIFGAVFVAAKGWKAGTKAS
jgi:hypothetical protein